jgi:hypothetical protein
MASRTTSSTWRGVFGLAFPLLLLSLALVALPSVAIAAPCADSTLGVSAPAGHASGPPLLAQWGTHGSGPGQFDGPMGMAINAMGDVYVTDEGSNRVQKFTAGGGFLAQWGTFGFAEGHFTYVGRVAVDALGSVYVCDPNLLIQKFSENGTFIIKWGKIGAGDGEFDGPSAIAVDAYGSVYVVDQYHCRVQKFTSTGGFVGKWGTRGAGDGQFVNPAAIAVAPSGHVYVVDPGNSRVQEFGPDGDFIRKWGSLGKGDGQFAGPMGVAVDRSGSVYVADTNNNRVQVFTADGRFVTKWVVTGSGYTSDLAVDASGNVYVMDHAFDWVRKYGPIESSDDGTPPTTKVRGVDDTWHREPVTLTFKATDNAGGSGVDFTEYAVASGGWTQGTQAIVPAPADHKGDGQIKVRFRSVDRAGNVERFRRVTVRIDTEEPSVSVFRTSVKKGRRVIIRFTAFDMVSPLLMVIGTVETSSGDVLHRATSDWFTPKGLNGWSFIARFRKGHYKATITAYDRAGNESSKKSNWLVVN